MHFWRQLARGSKVVGAFAVSLTGLLVQRPKSRRARAEWLTAFCRRVLKAAQVTWSFSGPTPERGAVVSNHLTYVDILIHAAIRPCVFVSAIETRQMPLIGWISMMAGTVYVVRGAGGSAAKAAGGMLDGFRDGLPVVFFPEGRTGLGDEPVLPLRSGLLATALDAGQTVTPGFLRYTVTPTDMGDGRTPRADVHWGKQSLPAHLWNLFSLRGVQAHLHFQDGPIHYTAAALEDRKIAAEETYRALLRLSASVL